MYIVYFRVFNYVILGFNKYTYTVGLKILMFHFLVVVINNNNINLVSIKYYFALCVEQNNDRSEYSKTT